MMIPQMNYNIERFVLINLLRPLAKKLGQESPLQDINTDH